MKESSRTLIATAFLLVTIYISVSSAEPLGFEIRLVHPQNDSLLQAEEFPVSVDLTGYHRFEQVGDNWPTVVWASKTVQLGTCDLKKASIRSLWDEADKEKQNRASPELESLLRRPQIDLEFNVSGTQKLENITADHVNERMAIFLDGRLLTAPTIVEPITDGVARLTTPWSLSEAQTVTERINCLISECQRK